MKAPQVIYLCLTTAFWIIGSLAAIAAVPNGSDEAKTGGVALVTLIVAVNLALLRWGGFFRSRD